METNTISFTVCSVVAMAIPSSDRQGIQPSTKQSLTYRLDDRWRRYDDMSSVSECIHGKFSGRKTFSSREKSIGTNDECELKVWIEATRADLLHAKRSPNRGLGLGDKA